MRSCCLAFKARRAHSQSSCGTRAAVAAAAAEPEEPKYGGRGESERGCERDNADTDSESERREERKTARDPLENSVCDGSRKGVKITPFSPFVYSLTALSCQIRVPCPHVGLCLSRRDRRRRQTTLTTVKRGKGVKIVVWK